MTLIEKLQQDAAKFKARFEVDHKYEAESKQDE